MKPFHIASLGIALGMAAWLAPGTVWGAGEPPASSDAIEDGAGHATGSDVDFGLGFDLDELDIFDDLALLAAEDVVVSAARRLQRIEESPSSITVLTRDQIRASGYDNLVDLMRLVPGADVYRITQGQGAIGLRSYSGWGGEKSLVLVDGRDVALHLLGMPMWMSMPFDMDSIERVEIIRGPGSTLYGANALQGVVNIVTRSPGESPLTTEVGASMAGLLTTSVDGKVHGRTGPWGYWANVGWDRRAPYALPGEIAVESLQGRLFLDRQGRGDSKLRVEAGINSMTGWLSSSVGDGPVEFLRGYLSSRLALSRTEILAVVDWLDVGIDLDLGLVLPDDPDGAVLARLPAASLPARAGELTAHHSFDLFRGNSLMVGASARAIYHMGGALITCPPSSPSDFDPGKCETNYVVETRLGLFLQDEWYLKDNLLLNLGARLDHNSINPEPGFSPRVALVYSPRPGWAARAGYGRAFRKPTFAESHMGVLLAPEPGTPTDMVLRLQHLFSDLGEKDLLNEYVDTVELGLRGRFLDERVNVTLDAFASSFMHHIYSYSHNMVPVPGFAGVPTIPDDASFVITNKELPDRAFGAELQITGRPFPWLVLSGSYALDRLYRAQTDPETGEPFWQPRTSLEPDHRLIGSVRLHLGDVSAAVDGMWCSKYTTRTRSPVSALAPEVVATVGGATLMNAHIAYRLRMPGHSSLEIGLAAINLLDVPFREVGGSDDAEGRTLGGGEIVGRRGRLFLRGEF